MRDLATSLSNNGSRIDQLAGASTITLASHGRFQDSAEVAASLSAVTSHIDEWVRSLEHRALVLENDSPIALMLRTAVTSALTPFALVGGDWTPDRSQRRPGGASEPGGVVWASVSRWLERTLASLSARHRRVHELPIDGPITWQYIGGVGSGGDAAHGTRLVNAFDTELGAHCSGSVVVWDAPGQYGLPDGFGWIEGIAGVVEAQAQLDRCDHGAACPLDDGATQIAAQLDERVAGSGTHKIVAHSLGVAALSHVLAADPHALDGVDELILVAGAAVAADSFDAYLSGGGLVTVLYDPQDPVVLNSLSFDESWIEEMTRSLLGLPEGLLDSPISIDGASLIPVDDAGHSGFFDLANPTSQSLLDELLD